MAQVIADIGKWLSVNWLSLFQSAGIVGGLIYSGRNYGQSAQARRIANILEVTRSHRDVWGRAIVAADLTRVLEIAPNPDLATQAVDYKERTFVTFVLLHLRAQFDARILFVAGQERETRMDIRDFLRLPIPAVVWGQVAPYQSKAFRDEINRILD